MHKYLTNIRDESSKISRVSPTKSPIVESRREGLASARTYTPARHGKSRSTNLLRSSVPLADRVEEHQVGLGIRSPTKEGVRSNERGRPAEAESLFLDRVE